MFAKYMARKSFFSSSGAEQSIEQIWNEINTGKDRPVMMRNSYQNMKWWLEKYFPWIEFQVKETKIIDTAVNHVMKCINAGYPVMVSTNHSRTSGHIILVVGYLQEAFNIKQVKFVCHDPYGKFDPQLLSETFGKKRFEGGMSLTGGDQQGPGRGILYDYSGIRRIRPDKHSQNKFFMISVKV